MRCLSLMSSIAGFLVTTSLAATSFAITDPAQAPPPPNQGQAPVVMTQQQQPMPNQVQVQQPPPPRLGLWAQGRVGGGIDFFGGAHGAALGQVGGGYITPNGVGITIYGAGRYMFSPPCALGTCASTNGGLLDIEIGIVARYTALPQARLHPVAELGAQLHLMPGENHFGVGYGGQLAVGAEFDLTDSLSLDVLARAQLFYAQFRSPTHTDFALIGFRIEPMLGLTYYF
jgi:hypothetical protein